MKPDAFCLSDGTTLDALINTDTREVSMRVLSDAEIYNLEMDRIFGKAWIVLAHASEIPNPGDYVTRDLGQDPVIVTRDKDGRIHVSLNICPHRGMRVCTAEAGNTGIHRCNYHGWAFRSDGSFVGAPVEREKMHGDVFAKESLGLVKARVSLYGGLVFATWSHDGPTLEEFLGDVKFYYDMLFCRTDSGLEALGPPQRVLINANWKTAGEQSCVDGYHTISLHRYLLDIGQYGGIGDEVYANAPAMYGVDIGTRQGHGLRCIPPENTFSAIMGGRLDGLTPDERLKILPPPGITPNLLPQLRKHLSDEQVRLLAEAPPQAGGFFPNILWAFIYAPNAEGEFVGALGLHSFVPRGPDHFEFYTWFFVEKDAPEDTKQKMLAMSIFYMGSSGTIEQDDSDTWPHMSSNAKGPQGRKQTLKYGALVGENKPQGWPGGGFVYEGFSKDDNQWQWWLAYRDYMLAGKTS
jgi:phenylpropionate dioxygenase-like ring-hydroxylating dioxygenase large terminal subunit